MDDKDTVFEACTRFLTHHYPCSPRQTLLDLAEFTPPEAKLDRYGQGQLIASFEQQIAELLGKPAAVFMPSGTMCQQIALQIWTERRSIRSVAFHPTCHLELHEDKGDQLLHGLHGRLVGRPSRLIGLDDLQLQVRVSQAPSRVRVLAALTSRPRGEQTDRGRPPDTASPRASVDR